MDNRKYFKSFIKFVTLGFCENLPYMILLWLLLCLCDIYGWFMLDNVRYLLYLAAWGFIVSYFLILILPLFIKVWIRRAYLFCVFSLASISAIIDFFSWIVLHESHYSMIPEIVRNTNLTEASEFFAHNATQSLIWSLLIAVVVLAIIVFATKLIAKRTVYNEIIGLFCLLGSILLCVHNPSSQEHTIIGKIGKWKHSFTYKTPNLVEYYHDISVESQCELPENIVIIIGESFSRYHSSLYGYEKITNPLLSSISSKMLYLFPYVEAPATYTLAAFPQFMSDYSGGSDGRPWYECITIQEVLSKAGYYSQWISNQNMEGFCDNDLTAYAKLTDKQFFLKTRAINYKDVIYDGELMPVVKEAISEGQSYPKKLYWIHLIGSHSAFSKRYPKEYHKYSENNYLSKPENQRKELSDYDNSILYNDYVIYTIIEEFKDKETFIVYFSDHGLDVYYTDSNYCNNARANAESIKAAIQIPFMIYTSDKLKNRLPDLETKITKMQKRYFCTTELLSVISEILGIQY